MCFIFFEDTPPAKNEAKGRKGAQNYLFFARQGKPNDFALPLKDACCAEPACCLLSCCCAPDGWCVPRPLAYGTSSWIGARSHPRPCCLQHRVLGA